MGRGGYNGGSAAKDGPKTDHVYIFRPPYIFTWNQDLDADLLRRARIVEAGCSLMNEYGAVQREFGYCLTVDSTATSTQSVETSLAEKFLGGFRRSKKAGSKDRPRIKWVSASHLLYTAPGGSDLVAKYHLDNPEAERPFEGTQLVESNSKDAA